MFKLSSLHLWFFVKQTYTVVRTLLQECIMLSIKIDQHASREYIQHASREYIQHASRECIQHASREYIQHVNREYIQHASREYIGSHGLSVSYCTNISYYLYNLEEVKHMAILKQKI